MAIAVIIAVCVVRLLASNGREGRSRLPF